MKQVLLVSIGFSPNVGGIETHFDDLTRALDRRGWRTWVLTYKPITTKVKAPFYERRDQKTTIFRIPVFTGLFYKLVKNPVIEFIYLAPGLFICLPIFLLIKGNDIDLIHSHGLIAGFASVFWGKVFSKKVITTTHSIYNFPQNGFYRNFAKWIFNNSDLVLTLSKQSKKEIERLGISKEKIRVFTYWIDLSRFRKIDGAKKKIGLDGKFVVFCASRLVVEKGIMELLKAASMWNKKILLVISSVGPLKSDVIKHSLKFKNISYVGGLSQDDVALYLSASDLLIVPSTHEEGFGRVILESLACGTSVIGSNRGAIPEAIDETVGKLIEITPENIKNTVEYFYKNSDKLDKLSKKARLFAEARYSEKNAETIIKAYK